VSDTGLTWTVGYALSIAEEFFGISKASKQTRKRGSTGSAAVGIANSIG